MATRFLRRASIVRAVASAAASGGVIAGPVVRPAATVIVGQVRSTASDLLKVLGVAPDAAAPEVRAAAARAAAE